jgi:hypothetical protein
MSDAACHFHALAGKCRGLASRATDRATIAALLDVAAYYDGEAVRLDAEAEPAAPRPETRAGG